MKLPLIDKTQTSSWVEFDVVQNTPKDKDQLVDWIGSNVTKQKNWYGKNTLTPPT
jgi:hypothetical protein